MKKQFFKLSVLVMILILSMGCQDSKNKQKDNLPTVPTNEEALRMSSSSSSDTRLKGILTLKNHPFDAGSFDVKSLINKDDVDARLGLVNALKYVTGQGANDALLVLVTDSSESVAQLALDLLKERPFNSGNLDIKSLINKNDFNSRGMLATALKNVTGQGANEALLMLIADEVAAVAEKALVAIEARPFDAGSFYVKELINKDNENSRTILTKGLAYITGEQANQALLLLGADSSFHVSTKALALLKKRNFDSRNMAIQNLINADDVNSRIGLARALKYVTGEDSIKALIQLQFDDDVWVRKEAIDSLKLKSESLSEKGLLVDFKESINGFNYMGLAKLPDTLLALDLSIDSLVENLEDSSGKIATLKISNIDKLSDRAINLNDKLKGLRGIEVPFFIASNYQDVLDFRNWVHEWEDNSDSAPQLDEPESVLEKQKLKLKAFKPYSVLSMQTNDILEFYQQPSEGFPVDAIRTVRNNPDKYQLIFVAKIIAPNGLSELAKRTFTITLVCEGAKNSTGENDLINETASVYGLENINFVDSSYEVPFNTDDLKNCDIQNTKNIVLYTDMEAKAESEVLYSELDWYIKKK